MMVLIGAIALGIAILSWRFIERPFRHGSLAPNIALFRYAVALTALVTVTATIKYTHGIPWRLTQQARIIEETILAGRGNCLADWTTRRPDATSACIISRPGRPGIALIGDSQAAALGPGIRGLVAKRDLGLRILTKSSCGPLLGANISHRGMPAFADDCAAFMNSAFQTVAKSPDFDTVILAGAWSSYAVLGSDAYHDTLQRTVTILRSAGKRVIIAEQVPSWSFDPVHLALASAIPIRNVIARVLWLDREHPFPANGRSELTDVTDGLAVNTLEYIARKQNIELVPLRDLFCNERECAFEVGDNLLYLDHSHLSIFGSQLVASSLGSTLLDSK
jgi:hypothetical protein